MYYLLQVKEIKKNLISLVFLLFFLPGIYLMETYGFEKMTGIDMNSYKLFIILYVLAFLGVIPALILGTNISKIERVMPYEIYNVFVSVIIIIISIAITLNLYFSIIGNTSFLVVAIVFSLVGVLFYLERKKMLENIDFLIRNNKKSGKINIKKGEWDFVKKFSYGELSEKNSESTLLRLILIFTPLLYTS